LRRQKQEAAARTGVVVVFSNGGVEAVGTHADLMHRSPTYAKLHELHADADPSPNSANKWLQQEV
jgi:hypothetical protein